MPTRPLGAVILDYDGGVCLRARFYQPTTGRFNRVDPFAGSQNDPQSLHKYAYAHANPVTGVDPSGLFSLSEVLISIGTTVRNYASQAYQLGKAKRKAENVVDILSFLSITAVSIASFAYPRNLSAGFAFEWKGESIPHLKAPTVGFALTKNSHNEAVFQVRFGRNNERARFSINLHNPGEVSISGGFNGRIVDKSVLKIDAVVRVSTKTTNPHMLKLKIGFVATIPTKNVGRLFGFGNNSEGFKAGIPIMEITWNSGLRAVEDFKFIGTHTLEGFDLL